MLTAQLVDTGLAQHIEDFAAATNRTVPDITRQAMKGMVRYAIDLTPPAGSGRSGKEAQRVGELAITRDLGLMGFAPVTLKGFREIKVVYGHVLVHPVRVKTKENPKFADPEAHRRARLSSLHSGRATRGGKQAFYVDRRKFQPMLKRLLAEVGRVASGWVPAARELGVPVPAWIARHGGSDRGTTVEQVSEGSKLSLRVTNHFPEGAGKVYEDTLRHIDSIKGYVANDFRRQLEAKMKGLWGKR
jgi:hypothetical protein